MRCTRQLRQNLFLHFAEQPRFMAYKLLQLTVEVRSSEGGLFMAAPLQRSGEYDVFSSDESVCPRSAVDLDSGDELMPTKCPHSSHPSNLQDRTSARLLTSPFHGGAESRVQIPDLRVLCQLKKFNLPKTMIVHFYTSIIESILTTSSPSGHGRKSRGGRGGQDPP